MEELTFITTLEVFFRLFLHCKTHEDVVLKKETARNYLNFLIEKLRKLNYFIHHQFDPSVINLSTLYCLNYGGLDGRVLKRTKPVSSSVISFWIFQVTSTNCSISIVSDSRFYNEVFHKKILFIFFHLTLHQCSLHPLSSYQLTHIILTHIHLIHIRIWWIKARLFYWFPFKLTRVKETFKKSETRLFLIRTRKLLVHNRSLSDSGQNAIMDKRPIQQVCQLL